VFDMNAAQGKGRPVTPNGGKSGKHSD